MILLFCGYFTFSKLNNIRLRLNCSKNITIKIRFKDHNKKYENGSNFNLFTYLNSPHIHLTWVNNEMERVDLRNPQ